MFEHTEGSPRVGMNRPSEEGGKGDAPSLARDGVSAQAPFARQTILCLAAYRIASGQELLLQLGLHDLAARLASVQKDIDDELYNDIR